MCITQKFWEALATALGRPELIEDPRFRRNADRFANREVLTEVLDAEFRRRSSGDWVEILAGVLPVAPVRDLAEALENPFLVETGMIGSVPHPARPDLKVLASPIRVDGRRSDLGPCPPLGADNERVLGEPALEGEAR